MKRLTIIGLVVMATGALGLYAKSVMQRTAKAYLYAYPLVIMDETRAAMGSRNEDSTNRLYHNHVVPDHSFRSVVRPNNDTLYSIAWLDLTQTPMVLSVPQTERYYVMPFMDAWTNVFTTVGTRETGSDAGTFVVTGPDWQGELPSDLTRIEAPTNMVWMIGRIQINGRDDTEAVKSLQQRFNLTPLEQWQQGLQQASSPFTESEETEAQLSPMELVEALNAQDFFRRFNRLLAKQYPASGDEPLLAQVQSLGIGADLQPSSNPLTIWLMNKSIQLVHDKIQGVAKLSRANDQGWSIALSDIGRYGTNYEPRAFIAKFGLGALPPEEAVYPSAESDKEGNSLHGANRYRLHFPAGETPPAQAFWSITMYDRDGFLINNALQRYTIGDRDTLQFNDDESLDIYIQHKRPAQGISNWLPSPAEDFAITMRIYLPDAEVLDSTWTLPAIEKLTD